MRTRLPAAEARTTGGGADEILARHASAPVYEGTAHLPDGAYMPRYWPTWLAVLVFGALGRFPRRIRLALGRLAGWIMRLTMRRRRRICERNIAHCLGQLDPLARRRLTSQQFHELGVALLESVAAWSLPAERVAALGRLTGIQHLDAARSSGRGVLVVSGHFLALNMALQLTSMVMKAYGVYRRQKNPVIDYLVLRGRERQGVRLFSHEDMRTPLKALRAGETVWFSPDQDQGLRHGAFVDFFGQSAATVTTVARLAARTGALVVPLLYRRLPGAAGYELAYLPALEDFPGDDVVAATRRINAIFEQQAYLCLSQYLWVHRRFKTRPPGEPSIYE